MKYLLDSGDILISNLGSKVGNVAMYLGEEPTIASRNLFVVKPKIDSRELFEKILDNQGIIFELARGEFIRSLSMNDLIGVEL